MCLDFSRRRRRLSDPLSLTRTHSLSLPWWTRKHATHHPQQNNTTTTYKALTQVEAFDASLGLYGGFAFLLWRSVYITKQVSGGGA